MRLALFYNPRLLFQRLAEEADKRYRLSRLRRTCAHWLTQYHIDSLELIEMAAKGGARTFYDIGAHVGSWTLLCRAIVPESRIFAFEPLPQHIEEFHSNVSKMSDVELFPIALGATEGIRSLRVTTYSDASGFLPLAEAGRKQWNIEQSTELEVQMRTLDGIVKEKELPLPDVIKLDVQGFEFEVLKGAAATLPHVRWILTEVSFRRFYQNQVLCSELAGFLAMHGFEMMALGHSARASCELTQIDVLFARLTQ